MSRVARRRGQGLDSEPLERSSVKYNMSIPAPKFIGTVNRPIRAPNHQRLPRTAQHKACSARPFIPRLSGSRIPRPGTGGEKSNCGARRRLISWISLPPCKTRNHTHPINQAGKNTKTPGGGASTLSTGYARRCSLAAANRYNSMETCAC